MTTNDAGNFHPEQRLIGNRFRLERQIGSGGMGDVYLAEDEQTREPCAVKLFAYSDDPQAALRFEREAAVLTKLTHPGIVRYRAHGYASDATPFLAMEWLDGEDLGHRLVRQPLTVRETISLGNAVLSALSAAHAEGIIHRDAEEEHSCCFPVCAESAHQQTEDHGSIRSLRYLG